MIGQPPIEAHGSRQDPLSIFELLSFRFSVSPPVR